MEQTCIPGKIQLSKETAENLAEMDKENWIEKRSDIVEAKGKGKVETWWLVYMENGATRGANDAVPTNDSFHGTAIHICPETDPKIRRLISWNVECLVRLLKEIVARRNVGSQGSAHFPLSASEPSESKIKKGETFLDEVKEIIALPRFDDSMAAAKQDQHPAA